MKKIGGWIGVFAVILFVSFGCGCIDSVIDEAEYYTSTTPDYVEEPKLVSVIHPGYYTGGCGLPADVSLIEVLTTYKWVDEYKAGGWDCSQMSAATECYLERCGHDVIIEMGYNPDGDCHAWILVYLSANTELGDGYFAPKAGYYKYECTGRYFVMEDHTDWNYVAEYQFNDIFAIEDLYLEKGWTNFEEEWAWWTN